MKTLFPIFAAILLLISTGCSPALYTSTNEELNYAETISSNVSVTTNSFSEQAYSEIGFVTTTNTDLTEAKDQIKKLAAKSGGDAIINFKVSVIRRIILFIIIPIPIDNYICRGTVIKYI